ncbi:UNVERIFIED_CONTAM: hypothetical protein PYX00_009681 [Menopon gallinae]|uniref:Putative E3 ubiquitin-protein ligase UBR7 n=1 Tax=Menopon gallinae TaxID=328185 RepID=A0AAW2HCI8_9NEOP
MDVPSVSGDEHRDDDGDKIVTMVDVLNEETELEEHANAVLGGADDKICTYSKGYVTRQPLYACATCNPPSAGNLAGVCLACSYRCHEGHDLVELYTKRNFRCDCGNSLFPNNKCNLEYDKDPVNENNEYNHNFKGLYCTCKRPYPDPDDHVEDEMIQCVICEDWFHKRHLELGDAKSTNFEEVICLECMKKHPFFWKYSAICQKQAQKESGEEPVNVTTNEDCGDSKGEQGNENKKEKQEDVCSLKEVKNEEVGTGSTCWPEGWRKNLCRCGKCLKMYEEKKLSFLLNEMDTVQYYEKKNQENAKESQYEKGLKALSSLDRVKQVEAIEGYQQMQTELIGYLQKFAENKKVVRQEDIWEFFEQIRARKKQKVEVPHFCR